MTDSKHTTTLPLANDSHLSGLLKSLINDDKRYEGLADLGVYDATIEGARNEIRATKEEELHTKPTAGMRGIAAKLRSLWPDLYERGGYYTAPDDRTDLHLHRLWAVMQEADKLADAVESTAAPLPR